MFHPMLMSAADTGLLAIDVQEKLMALIPRAAEVVRNIAFLVDAAQLLNVPVQATEQYPKGLGSTVPELARRIPSRLEKTTFSCCALPAVVESFRRAARPKILLAGIESHVCVQQTALDLLAMDFRVYVAADAVASRYELDHTLALKRMELSGAVITTGESAVFEWIGGSHAPQFKEISKLVQERMKAMSCELQRKS